MALRGENIGTAYVRILADGSGLDRSIRDQMEDVDWDGMGRKGSKEFQEGFAEEQEKAPNKNRLKDSVVGPLIRGKWLSEDFFQSENWTTFRNDLEKHYGDAGKRAGNNLEKQLFEGMDFDQLNRKLKNITPIVVAAQKEIDKEILDEQRRTERERADLISKGLEEQAQSEQQRAKNTRQSAEQQRKTERETAQQASENERLRRRGIGLTKAAYTDLMELVERMNKGEEEQKHDRDFLIRQLKGLRLEMDRLGISTATTNDRFRDNEERLYRMHPRLTKFTRQMDKLGDSVGKAFGRGSRNDFVNFLGVVGGGITKTALGIIPRMIGAVTSYLGKLRQIGEAGGSVMGQLLKDSGKVIAGIGAGLGGLFVIIGPVVSIFSQLLGAAMALISSIGFGMVGAAAALYGALLPLGAGVAAVILGFKNLDGEAKKAASGVADAFKGLGKAAADGLTFDRKGLEDDHDHAVYSFERMMHMIEQRVNMLKPVMQKAGRGMADAMNIALTEGPLKRGGAFDKFVVAMRGPSDQLGWLGTNTRILGRIFSETFGGLLGLFRGVMPITHEFLSWVRDITVGFDKWANSAQGIQDTRTWLQWAADSARELGGFLGAVAQVMGTILDAGSEQGDSLFQSMTDSLHEWNDELQKDGGANLREWFADSGEFIRKVGDALVNLLELFQDLDTQTSRKIATTAFESIARILRVIEAVLGPVVDLFDGLNKATHGAAGGLAAAAFIFPKINAPLQTMRTNLASATAGMTKAEAKMARLKSASGALAGAAGLALITDASRRGGNAVGGLENILGGAAAGFAVGGPIGAAVGGLGGAFLTMVQHSKAAGDSAREAYKKIAKIDTIEVAKKSLEDLKGTLDEVTGAYTGATRAAALQKLQQAGLIGVAEDFNISQRTMINAALGQKGAMNELYPVIGKVESKIRDLTARQAELQQRREDLNAVDLSGDESGALTAHINRQIEAIDKESVSVERNKKELQGNLDTLRLMPGQLRKQGREVRETAAATADYSGLLHGIPRDVRTAIEAEGIIPSVKGVAKVAEKYDLVDRKHIKTLIEASGTDATVKDVLKVIAKNNELDKQSPNPKISAEPSKFNTITRDAGRVLDVLNGRIVSPRIDVQSNALTAAQATNQWLSTINDETVYIDVQRRGGRAPITATGGLFNYAQTRLIGESGPEAVVPLNRPLGMVDPSVRWLSALAQGKEPMARGGVVGTGKTVNVEQHIYSPNADPRAVATEAINHMVATGY